MRRHPIALVVCVALAAWVPSAARADVYLETNLVSSVSGLAPNTDASLQNPWGVSFGPTSPFWVSDQVTGISTLYNASGVKQGLVVTIPPGGGAGNPTGQVFNSTASDFAIPGSSKSTFIFDTLNGTLAAWNGGTTATIVASTPGASYTGLALANNGSGNFLYAANEGGQGGIDAFNSAFQKTNLAGNFTDPNLPSGFIPYNIQALGGKLYVAYENNQANDGGVVDAFDPNGNFLQRISANNTGGHLQHPWGMALAPAGFGQFANDLLVGNEHDGNINAYNPSNGSFVGTMSLVDKNNNPTSIGFGLWALEFVPSNPSVNPNTLFFVAGIENETGGLLGSIQAVPEPGVALLSGLAATFFVMITLLKRRAVARA